MAKSETFLLAKMAGCAAEADIVRVVRTYLTEKRAEEERELLEQKDGMSNYRVIAVEYIED